MGEAARQRARPWLAATSTLLLLVGLLVAGVMLWVARITEQIALNVSTEAIISSLDLLIASAILVTVLTLGQAIVRYEVFTGKALPQKRFHRHWHNAVILALGYGGAMSVALKAGVHPVYTILVVALMLTLFYALFSRNSYAERTWYMQHLRPFLISQRLYDRLVSGSMPTDQDVSQPFSALCREVLGARTARLAALGPLAPLAGPELAYPPGNSSPLLPLDELTRRLGSPQTICVPVEPARYGGATWAIPLWGERGLIGVLLLGEKEDGGLYTQEEIEIARASGERLIDTQASAEMARRLMALQRQRLAQSEILDRRARRALHDDILPRIHEAMLALSDTRPDSLAPAPGLMDMLAGVPRQIANLLRDMPPGGASELAQLGLIGALRSLVEGEAGKAFDSVSWQIDPVAEEEARHIPPLTSEVVYYAAREAIRNSERHGRGGQAGRSLHLCIRAVWQDGITIIVEDDGVGMGASADTTAEVGGGNGLALHSTMMAVAGGTLTVESAPGRYTRIILSLPRTAYRTVSADS
jgi:signal transduction histidine kinase